MPKCAVLLRHEGSADFLHIAILSRFLTLFGRAVVINRFVLI